MHHELDIRPIPTDVLYVNELSLAGEALYETKQDMDKALTRKTKSNAVSSRRTMCRKKMAVCGTAIRASNLQSKS